MWLRTLMGRGAWALTLLIPAIALAAEAPRGGPERTLRGDWAVVHATVHPLALAPVPTAPLPDATVVVQGGVVRCVGRCAVPAGLPVFDAEGATLLPGFVEVAAHLGQLEIWAEPASHDGAPAGTDNAAHVRARDGLVLQSRVVQAARWGGVVAAVSRPLGDALVVGSGVAFRTAAQGEGVTGAVLADRAGVHVQLGEAGKRAAGRPLVAARSGQIAMLRALLAAARAEIAAGAKRTAPDANLGSSSDRAALLALAPVLDRTQPLVVHAHRAEDIEAALRLCQQEKLRMIVVGGGEAWRVATALAAADVPVVLAPGRVRALTFETRHAREDAARILHAAGVRVALATGSPHGARNLRWEAGWQVGLGLPADAALAAVTVVPAQLFGLETALGVRVGSAAGFVLMRGDPLGLDGRVVAVATGNLLEIQPRQR